LDIVVVLLIVFFLNILLFYVERLRKNIWQNHFFCVDCIGSHRSQRTLWLSRFSTFWINQLSGHIHRPITCIHGALSRSTIRTDTICSFHKWILLLKSLIIILLFQERRRLALQRLRHPFHTQLRRPQRQLLIIQFGSKHLLHLR
jgi:hypothetical protein